MFSAQARFLKQDKKAAREALKEGNTSQQSSTAFSPSISSTASAYDPNFTNPVSSNQNLNKKKSSNKKVPIYMQHKYNEQLQFGSTTSSNAFNAKINQPKQSEIVDLSSDDDESDDEVHHFEVSLGNFLKFIVLCIMIIKAALLSLI